MAFCLDRIRLPVRLAGFPRDQSWICSITFTFPFDHLAEAFMQSVLGVGLR